LGLAQIRHKKRHGASGHVLRIAGLLRGRYSGCPSLEQSDSQTSFPSRLIVHMPLEQLCLIIRESHLPNRNLRFDGARPCDVRAAPRSISSYFSLRIMHPPVNSLLLPADCRRLFAPLSEIKRGPEQRSRPHSSGKQS